jgi:hypothetical protein
MNKIKPEGSNSGVIKRETLRKLENFLKTAHLCPEVGRLLSWWSQWFDFQVKHKGTLKAVMMAKEVNSVALRYASGQRITPLSFMASDRDGFPSKMHPFRVYLRGDRNQRRVALTILSGYKLVPVAGPLPSLDPITKTGPMMPSPDPIVSPGDCWDQLLGSSSLGVNVALLQRLWKETLLEEFPSGQMPERFLRMQKACRLHLSSKNGPNGPCIATAVIDRNALHGTQLLANIESLAWLTANERLVDLLDLKKVPCRTRVPGLLPAHSRLRVKYEEGGKCRLFAICDNFTQSSLTGIHRELFVWLSKQPEDGTFSHNQCAKRVREWTKRPPNRFVGVHSLDLSKATDRFPRALQREVISQMFGQETGLLWEKIITDRDFLTPDGTSTVRWAVGQPLGALSSWAAFAVTHHLLIRTLIKYENLRRSSSWSHYQVIGDDVAIRGDRLANTYRNVVAGLLGVGISLEKSFTPSEFLGERFITNLDLDEDTQSLRARYPSINERYNAAEIAKRVFVNGVEITPLPPPGIIEGLGAPPGFPSLLQDMYDRGYYRDGTVVPVPALAKLSWRPSEAIAQSTFPMCAAPPYWRVTAVHKESSRLPLTWRIGDRDFGEEPILWHQYPQPVIAGAFRQEITERVDEAIVRTRKIAGKQAQKALEWAITKPVAIRVARWELARAGVAQHFVSYVDQGLESLEEMRKEMFGTGLEMQTSEQDLKSWIGRLHTLLDLELILRGRSRFEDEKVLTSRFISAVARKVLQRLRDLYL